MPFNVQDFRNKLVAGGARPTQFEMQIAWPDAIRGSAGVSGAERDFRFLCELSEIPASTVAHIPVSYFGRKLNFAGDRTYAPLGIRVINDEDFKVRKAMEAWMKAIQDHSTTLSTFNGGIAAGSYVTDGVVTQFGRNNSGEVLASYKFIGMFPVEIGAIALDWSATDTIENFTVQFQYQWWEQVTGVQIGVGVGSNL
jgi:hypothetical protein